MSVETELKLTILTEDIEKFSQHPVLKSAIQPPKTQTLLSIYFDTEKQDLLQQGIGLRVRHMGKKRLQTLKTQGSVLGGLHRRHEWETEVESDVPQIDLIPEDALPKRFLHKLKHIKPIFTTRFERKTWHITPSENCEIEIALDQGEVYAGEYTMPISEVELELKAGSPSVLYQLALQLQETLRLTIENRSKAARGYQLHKSSEPQYYKAKSIVLTKNMSAEQAFVNIVWHCLNHLQSNEAMVLHGDDIEGVHQMRVALRRLRSCLSVYKSIISYKTSKFIRQELKWISNVLGEARDWDVFQMTLHDIRAQVPENKEIEALQTLVVSLQRQSYVLVRETLNLPRYDRLLLSLGEWLTNLSWRQTADRNQLNTLDKSVASFSNQQLDYHHQRVYKRGKYFDQLTPEQRHELRIEIKKMAYSVRFFTSLYSQESVKNYSKRLSQLQDELGILNDVHVAGTLLEKANINSNTPARHFLEGWYTYQRMIHLESLAQAWQNLLTQKNFWK